MWPFLFCKANCLASQYVKKYVNRLQNSMAVESLTDLKVEYREVTWGNYQYCESGDDEEKDTYGARIRFCRIFGEKKFRRTAYL